MLSDDIRCKQCWKFPQVRQSEADKFGGGLVTFCWFHVYDLRFKTWGPTTFLTEFQTLDTGVFFFRIPRHILFWCQCVMSLYEYWERSGQYCSPDLPQAHKQFSSVWMGPSLLWYGVICRKAAEGSGGLGHLEIPYVTQVCWEKFVALNACYAVVIICWEY